jgi:hypothetical protein
MIGTGDHNISPGRSGNLSDTDSGRRGAIGDKQTLACKRACNAPDSIGSFAK